MGCGLERARRGHAGPSRARTRGVPRAAQAPGQQHARSRRRRAPSLSEDPQRPASLMRGRPLPAQNKPRRLPGRTVCARVHAYHVMDLRRLRMPGVAATTHARAACRHAMRRWARRGKRRAAAAAAAVLPCAARCAAEAGAVTVPSPRTSSRQGANVHCCVLPPRPARRHTRTAGASDGPAGQPAPGFAARASNPCAAPQPPPPRRPYPPPHSHLASRGEWEAVLVQDSECKFSELERICSEMEC